MSVPSLPKLVLLPGMLNDETLWDRITPLLRPKCDLVMPIFTEQTTIGAMADHAVRMAGDQRLALVGFSMGGYVAQEILSRVPDRVAGLALVDTQAGAADEATRVIMSKTAHAARKDFETVLARLRPANIHPDRQGDEALVAHLLRMFRAVGMEAFGRQCAAVADRPDRRDVLAARRLPTLIACGRQDMICPPERSEELARLMPHATMTRIEQCGHMSPLEQPEALAAALVKWIGELA